MTTQPNHADAIKILSKPEFRSENAGKLAILKAAMAGEQDPAKLREFAKAAKK